MACIWHRTPALERGVVGSQPTPISTVLPNVFFAMKTGQYILRTCENHCYTLDMRYSLPHPIAYRLNPD